MGCLGFPAGNGVDVWRRLRLLSIGMSIASTRAYMYLTIFPLAPRRVLRWPEASIPKA